MSGFLIKTKDGERGPFDVAQLRILVENGKLPRSVKVLDVAQRRPVTVAEVLDGGGVATARGDTTRVHADKRPTDPAILPPGTSGDLPAPAEEVLEAVPASERSGSRPARGRRGGERARPAGRGATRGRGRGRARETTRGGEGSRANREAARGGRNRRPAPQRRRAGLWVVLGTLLLAFLLTVGLWVGGVFGSSAPYLGSWVPVAQPDPTVAGQETDPTVAGQEPDPTVAGQQTDEAATGAMPTAGSPQDAIEAVTITADTFQIRTGDRDQHSPYTVTDLGDGRYALTASEPDDPSQSTTRALRVAGDRLYLEHLGKELPFIRRK